MEYEFYADPEDEDNDDKGRDIDFDFDDPIVKGDQPDIETK